MQKSMEIFEEELQQRGEARQIGLLYMIALNNGYKWLLLQLSSLPCWGPILQVVNQE
jgi:hypothetical protein